MKDLSESADLYCRELRTLPQPGVGKILVTGATGYVGGRLVPELLARGYDVRVMVRAHSSEICERWPDAEVVVGDALDPESLIPALAGVHTAYYLIHSLLGGHKQFEQMDIRAATNFREAADRNKVARIIYLGALGDLRTNLSKHLRSRQEVCSELARGSTAVTALRAAIIMGSGSASFEVIKHLVSRLPVIFLPPWAITKCQPIAIRNVITYLVGVLESPVTAGVSYDIGGPDILSYREMLRVFAEVLGLRRLFVRLPLYNLRLYSYVIGLVTPVAHSIVFCLLESAVNTVVCQSNDIPDIIEIKLLPYREAVLRALTREDQDRIHTRWSDAYPPAHELAIKLAETDRTKLYTKSASLQTDKASAALFDSICRVGGKEGWFDTNWLWKLRGMLDKMLMGVGTSRGRRHSRSLRVNDVLDFWRVEEIDWNRRLLLRAEMKIPGRAWLELSIHPREGGGNTLSVNAYYQSFGFWGALYWYACHPFHSVVFRDLIEQIERRSPASGEMES
ncbi:MAG: SDR family oxidoreductase [Armatimonadota bacterium]